MDTYSGHVLIVDADATFCGFVSALLARVGIAPRTAGGGTEALEAVRDERPALVVLDVALPDMSGYELCRELRDEFGEDLAIIFVSGERTEAFDRAAGLLIGADDYIVKPADPDEFLARVRRLLVRSRRGEWQGLHERRRGERRSRGPTIAPSKLTSREREVLQLMAEGRRTGEIAAELFISPKTVASHVQRMLAKLEVNSRSQAVALAYRTGLIKQTTAATGDGPDL